MSISDISNIVNNILSLKKSIRVPTGFIGKVRKIDQLLENDQTGIVRPLIDYMVDAASVNIELETKNPTLNAILKKWQTGILNQNVNIDIPGGLDPLSEQYFRERWRSSFIGVKVVFEPIDFGQLGKFELPTKMWLVDGTSLKVKNDKGALNSKEYFIKINQDDEKPFKSEKGSMVIIRKPYNMWYDDFPSPFLANRGVLFNALLKSAITEKQSELVEALIPYLLKLSAGSDRLAQLNQLPKEQDLTALKNQIVDKLDNCNNHHDVKNLIAAFSYDTNLEHIIPDLTKALDPSIKESVNKDILSGMGMIEIESLSDNRKDSILNPKVLITEVEDALKDWTELLKSVMVETINRNKSDHPKIANNEIKVIPGVIKSFLTDKMRDLIKNYSARGLLSIQTSIECGAGFNSDVESNRRIREKEAGWEELFYPRVIQNQEQHDKVKDFENVPDDRTPGTPEANDFDMAKPKKKKKSKKYKKAEEIIVEILPKDAQNLWLSVYNNLQDLNDNKKENENEAWAKVKEFYGKVEGKKVWEKK